MADKKTYLTLAQLSEMLSISTETGRNWLKLGKIIHQRMHHGKPLFEMTYAEKLKKNLISGSNPSLRSRRNKKYASGRNMYNSYVSSGSLAQKQVEKILQLINELQLPIEETEIRALLAAWAVQLLGSKEDILIRDLIGGEEEERRMHVFAEAFPQLFMIECPYEAGEDALGLLYISLRNLSNRKVTGTYYTPASVVRKLCGKIGATHVTQGRKVLDPCCGTGNFLIRLPNRVRLEDIYANDSDYISACITRINLAVKYQVQDRQILYEHVTTRDYLSFDETDKYDIIIGNPPWGYSFTKEERDRLKKKYICAGNTPESYDLFIEQALRNLNPDGVLSFVLPEAILSSRSHLRIREEMLHKCAFEYLAYLGNAFDGVTCPSLIFQMRRSDENAGCVQGLEIETSDTMFRIRKERELKADYFGFQVTDEEYEVLRKIAEPEGKVFLAGNADFALGIVTGGNAGVVSDEKTAENEPVWRGTDVMKYGCREASTYMIFKPDELQQVAPEKFYRAKEKLIYRFINKELVFAYDDTQRLSLNSCNILIPHIEGLKMKYILAVLNSRTAQFFFEKTFHSVKVLRSHLERIPIPMADAGTQREIIRLVEQMIETRSEGVNEKRKIIYDRIDRMVAKLYGLNEEMYRLME